MNNLEKILSEDTDGMMTYDYLVNHVETCHDEVDKLVDNLLKIDRTGQFLASSARYLTAVDEALFHPHIGRLVEGTIEVDRERRYIGSLLQALWGDNYMENADEIKAMDDNFRRIFKRIYPTEII